MKKQLLALAAVAALIPALNANAEESALTEVWKTAQLPELIGNWGGATTNWDNPDEIMKGGNMRFATAFDGKVYTINQKTQCIAEITANGINDVYALPAPANTADFYGCAISADEAGNFLIGMNFVQRPNSSIKFAVYSPAGESSLKEITLPIPEGMTIGRLDCIGRVLGDLTKEAYFFIPPETGNYTAAVRIIKSTGDGTVAGVKFEDVTNVEVAGNYTQQNIAQPAYHNLAAAGQNATDFYFSSANHYNQYYAGYVGGTLSAVAPNMKYTTTADNNGFDTFAADGKRYFVRNYSNDESRHMSIVVTDEKGYPLCTWEHPNFTPDGAYSTIITEPADNNTFNIYVYNCTNKAGGAAAMLNFDPAKAGEAVVPVGTVDNPYRIANPEDLTGLAAAVTGNEFYVTLENDIDMTGVEFTPINKAYNVIHIDGQNHVISNLTAIAEDNSGLFKFFQGSIKNLGLVNTVAEATGDWGSCGTFIGYTFGEVLIENCFAKGGSTKGFYSGGLVAGVNTDHKLTIRKCYSTADVNPGPKGSFSGGLVGAINTNGVLTVENAYAAGTITGTNAAAGIVAGINPAYKGQTITLTNVATLCPSIKGNTAGAIIANPNDNTTITNGLVCEETLVNDAAVTDGVAKDKIIADIKAWAGFNANAIDADTHLPVLAWQRGLIRGDREDYPIIISSAEELVGLANAIQSSVAYVAFDKDIDMAGVEFKPINKAYNVIHIDGQNHVISNLTAKDPERAGLFQYFQGSIKNLGLVNTVSEMTGAWGVSGTLIGYTFGEVLIENCFAKGGSTKGYYSGGFVGGVNNGHILTIRNCYSTADVNPGPKGSFSGGLVGAINANGVLTVENAYSAGMVKGSTSAGIVSVNPNGQTVTLTNVVAYNPVIEGSAAAKILCAGMDATVTDCAHWEKSKVNKNIVDGGKTQAELNAMITAWPAFNDKVNDGMPVLAWQEANGTDAEFPEFIYEGSKEKPYKLATAEDVASIGSKIGVGNNYFVVENDIDMTGIAYTAPLGNNNFSGCAVFIDGRNHVISNLSCNAGDYPSFIGVFMGEIKNLGLENVNIVGGWGSGVFGGFTGHASYAGTTVIDNCYATGSVSGGAYTGGIGGYNNGTTIIRNSYSDVDVKGGASGAAGILGWNAGGSLTIENVYASGNVIAQNDGPAAGIATISAGTLTLTEVVALNGEINGKTVHPLYVSATEASTGDTYSADMKLNGEAVTDGKPVADLKKAIMGWEAFNSTEVNEESRLPILAWQKGFDESQDAIEDIEAADADAPAVYYNLQGVEVANPAAGIYIVRRGNKVTKEVIR